MHACGHDCHIAMLLGALRILAGMTDELHGEVRALFQASEENGRGALMAIDAGVTEGVDGAFAMHIWSEVDAGTASCEPGPRMASTDWFRIDVEGTSCHGAMPQRGADAIIAAAEYTENLYEYTPMQIKQALTGWGKADKKQIQQMVKFLLHLEAIPRPDDAADGIAAAITHIQAGAAKSQFKMK